MKIQMNLKENSYDIIVERGALLSINEHLNLNRKVLIVTDNGVPKEYANKVAELSLSPIIITLEQGESTKSFKCLELLLKSMLENSFSRKDCVVAVGGGVIGDLAGFAAATFMRGIDFYNIPTTLLSQVDSSIGGKVAINFEGIKNIIGAFYQPKKVVIDPEVLKTLPKRQISNGLAEAIKMGLTSDKELFEIFEKENVFENIDEIIVRSLNVKKHIVELDEKESSLRKILNFGHTIGHAIESANFGNLYHGECVALGMLYMCSLEIRERLIKALSKLDLLTEIDISKDEILSALKHDKKGNNDSVSAIFVSKIGECEIRDVKFEELINLI